MSDNFKYKYTYFHSKSRTDKRVDTYDKILNDPYIEDIYCVHIKKRCNVNILPPNIRELIIQSHIDINFVMPESLTYFEIDTFPHNNIKIPLLPSKLQKLRISYTNARLLDQKLPENLHALYINSSKYIKISKLPIFLAILSLNNVSFDINGLNISSLNHLHYFSCSKNNLVSLPKLPPNLKILFCSHNKINQLPRLPYRLEDLQCSYNKITKLPDRLPMTLISLYIDHNKLTSLPRLPYKLKTLNCNHNDITHLPNLPNTLKILNCGSNAIKTIDKLPDTIRSFDCSFNYLTKLPDLSECNCRLINISANNIKYLPNSFPETGHIPTMFEGTPIQHKIDKYYNGNKFHYIKHQKAVNTIEKWYIEVRYNPKYLYCQRKVKDEYIKLTQEE